MADPAVRRAALLVFLAGTVLAALSGCGFRPLYGDSSGGNATALASVDVAPIADRSGQKLRNLLLERLKPGDGSVPSAYLLSVELTESKQELAIRKDESATRANLTVQARFRLNAIRQPELGVLTGSLHSTNSYNILDSEFATLVAENDARDRALRSIAEDIRRHVAAGLRNPQMFVPPEPEEPENEGRARRR